MALHLELVESTQDEVLLNTSSQISLFKVTKLSFHHKLPNLYLCSALLFPVPFQRATPHHGIAECCCCEERSLVLYRQGSAPEVLTPWINFSKLISKHYWKQKGLSVWRRHIDMTDWFIMTYRPLASTTKPGHHLHTTLLPFLDLAKKMQSRRVNSMLGLWMFWYVLMVESESSCAL